MIIALHGTKRTGKSTSAAILKHKHGFREYALAEPMKAALKEAFGWLDEHMDGCLKDAVDARWGISPRQALQAFGTEFAQYMLEANYPGFRKTTGRTLWVRRFLEDVYDPRHDWVVPDVRFPHEIEYLRENADTDVVLVRLQNDSALNERNHESERHEIHGDYTVLADTTDALVEQARHVFDRIMLDYDRTTPNAHVHSERKSVHERAEDFLVDIERQEGAEGETCESCQ
jgi:hypothetical protein